MLPSTAKVFQSAMTPCRLEFIIEGSERGVISVRSLRRDSVSTASDGEGNKNLICKSCGDTYARCTCIKCVECGGMLVNNVGGWPGKDGTGKLIGVLRLDLIGF